MTVGRRHGQVATHFVTFDLKGFADKFGLPRGEILLAERRLEGSKLVGASL
jgi:hypothetical protein